MMRRNLTLALAGGALALGLMVAAPAEAGHAGWSFGAGFRVGGFDFQIGFRDGGRYGPGPYFHTRGALSYPGHRCGSYCLRSGRDFYHHYTCPLVGLHFSRFGYSSGYYLEAYPPPGFFFRGYYGGYHDRHYRHRAPSRRHGYYLHRDRHRDRWWDHRGDRWDRRDQRRDRRRDWRRDRRHDRRDERRDWRRDRRDDRRDWREDRRHDRRRHRLRDRDDRRRDDDRPRARRRGRRGPG